MATTVESWFGLSSISTVITTSSSHTKSSTTWISSRRGMNITAKLVEPTRRTERPTGRGKCGGVRIRKCIGHRECHPNRRASRARSIDHSSTWCTHFHPSSRVHPRRIRVRPSGPRLNLHRCCTEIATSDSSELGTCRRLPVRWSSILHHTNQASFR